MNSGRFRFKIAFTTDCKAFCTFQRNTWTPFGSLCEVLVQQVEVESRDDRLTNVRTFGNPDDDFECHSSDSDDYDDDEDSFSYDMKSFYIYDSPLCKFVPSGIANYFKNLTILVIAHSGLMSVTSEDLKPFKYLKGLYMDNNRLEVLEADLFVHNWRIQEMNFSGNKLKRIAFNILDPLTSLKRADFFRNHCISMGAETAEQLRSLKKTLRLKFEPKTKKAFEDNDDEILECCKGLYETEK